MNYTLFCNKKERCGFTLSELIVVIIIIGVMASLVIPRFTSTFERVRAAEGVQILTALLGAQKSYEWENGSYATDAADLDVEIDRATNFDRLSITVTNPVDPVANPIATIVRADSYTLCINEEGTISCKDGAAGFTCEQAGITDPCP